MNDDGTDAAGRDVRELLRKALLGLAVLFLAVAAWGVYSSANRFIDLWIGHRFAPVYHALLNLAVLVVALYVIRLLVRERG